MFNEGAFTSIAAAQSGRRIAQFRQACAAMASRLNARGMLNSSAYFHELLQLAQTEMDGRADDCFAAFERCAAPYNKIDDLLGSEVTNAKYHFGIQLREHHAVVNKLMLDEAEKRGTLTEGLRRHLALLGPHVSALSNRFDGEIEAHAHQLRNGGGRHVRGAATVTHQNTTVQFGGGNQGVVNTGQMQDVAISIQAVENSGQEKLAKALAQLVEAIHSTQGLTIEQKEEANDALQLLTEEAAKPPDQRRPSAFRVAMKQLAGLVSLTADLGAVWSMVEAPIRATLGG